MNLKCKTINIKMREKSVIIALFLLIGGALVGLTLWSNHGGQDDMWRLDDVYSSQHSTMSRASSVFTNSSASSDMTNGGVALSMSRSSLKSSRAHVPCYSYAPTTHATSSSSSMSNGASPAGGGLYTTSFAAMRSFGDGSSSSMGSSRSSTGGAAAAAGGVYTSMPSAGSSSWGGGGSSSSSGAYASSIVMSSAQSANPANAIAMGSSAGSNSLYSGFAYTSMLDQYQMASYGNSGMNRISGRQNLSSMGGGDDTFTYDAWLLWMEKLGYRFGTPGDGNSYTFTTEQAYQAFLIWYKSKTGKDYEEGASQFSYKEWCKWYMTNNGTHTSQNGSTFTFFQSPVGDILPLFVFVLMYVAFVAARRYKLLQRQKK